MIRLTFDIRRFVLRVVLLGVVSLSVVSASCALVAVHVLGYDQLWGLLGVGITSGLFLMAAYVDDAATATRSGTSGTGRG